MDTSGIEHGIQRFTSKVLWHFTGYEKETDEAYKILKLILHSQKLKLSNNHESIVMPSNVSRLGHPCACMCDIPFKDLKIHIERYDKCGIAF